MHEPDPVLGWKNKPGSYVVPPYQPSGQAVHVTFLDDGRRRTRANSTMTGGEKLVLVGDSYTQGWAINDEETYAWKLQERIPSLQVLNFGTGAYGSYQSLLLLEQVLPVLTRATLVLYGFNEFHESRNVADASWLKSLSYYSRRGHVALPFGTRAPGTGLVRHPPETYVSLPLRESSALIALVEDAYMKIKTWGRMSEKRAVTEQMLLQMNNVSMHAGARLIVVLLVVENRQSYVDFLGKNGIKYVDCDVAFTDAMKVPGEGHPNGRMNTLWADCIAQALMQKNLLADSETGDHGRVAP
jgi:hypothetical protein